MKRFLAAFCACLFGFCGLMTGCSRDQANAAAVQVVCTIFPEYDWVRQIVGDVPDVAVTLLIQGGTDLHSYQPSVKDIAAIAKADLFCYVGGASDEWVTNVLHTAENEQVRVVSLLDVTDADEELVTEGMQDEEHHHEHDHNTSAAEAQAEPELDEHVWLSLRRAQMACTAIRDALCAQDPAHATAYQENCAAYLKKLQTLDQTYETMVQQDAVRDTILVADRFPFRYLAEDYGIHYYAAFPGCSAETEASFETIAFLSEKLTQLELPCVLTTESSDQSLARTILESAHSDSVILTMDSLQSVTKQQLEDGVSYLDRMENNYTILKEALTSGEKEMQ